MPHAVLLSLRLSQPAPIAQSNAPLAAQHGLQSTTDSPSDCGGVGRAVRQVVQPTPGAGLAVDCGRLGCPQLPIGASSRTPCPCRCRGAGAQCQFRGRQSQTVCPQLQPEVDAPKPHPPRRRAGDVPKRARKPWPCRCRCLPAASCLPAPESVPVVRQHCLALCILRHGAMTGKLQQPSQMAQTCSTSFAHALSFVTAGNLPQVRHLECQHSFPAPACSAHSANFVFDVMLFVTVPQCSTSSAYMSAQTHRASGWIGG